MERMPGTPILAADDPHDALDEIVLEWVKRIEARAPVDRQAWLLRYPEHAAALSEFLGDHDRVDVLTRPLRILRATVAATPEHFDLPLRLGDYELLQEVGRGGMGVVYKARQHSLARFVAVKIINRLNSLDDAQARVVEREAQVTALLDHPGLVPIYEVGSWRMGGGAARPYLCLKWIEGGALAEHLPRFAEPRRAVLLVRAVARAVHHAHGRGILHRDLKPSNILLDGADNPCVTDFGLAGRAGDDAKRCSRAHPATWRRSKLRATGRRSRWPPTSTGSAPCSSPC
jgi:serine/threonine protein kinase